LLLDRVLLARLLAAGLDTMVTFLARVLLDTVVGSQALALAVHTLGSMRTVGTGGRRGRGGTANAIGTDRARSAAIKRTRSAELLFARTSTSVVDCARTAIARSAELLVARANASSAVGAGTAIARTGGRAVRLADTTSDDCTRCTGNGDSTCIAELLGARANASSVEGAGTAIARTGGRAVRDALAILTDFTGCILNMTHCAGRGVTYTTITVTTTFESFRPAMGSSWAGIISVWTRQRRSLESVAVAASICRIAPLGAFFGG